MIPVQIEESIGRNKRCSTFNLAGVHAKGTATISMAQRSANQTRSWPSFNEFHALLCSIVSPGLVSGREFIPS